MLYPEIVVAGCGNPLFADDGFGPAVIEELQKLKLPPEVKVLDAGLGGPHFVFTLLDERVTRKLVIVDIADFGAEPGSLTRLRVEDLPPGTYRDAHSWDLAEPLQRLKDEVEVTIIGCQPKRVMEFEIGLTEEVRNAIPDAVRMVLEEIGVTYGTAGFCLQKEGAAAEGGTGAPKEGGAS
ncbi:MAG: coenzyme F420-reducing hydrogenase, FrhD protein [Methanomicrobiales archaeon]|nr:coenzyme F420-reducing hydrogenase, FrhD protein [Methanomicrobiales archaeon]